jgi:hypothetical protein
MWLRFRISSLMWTVVISSVLLAVYREVQQSRQRALDYQLRALDHALGEYVNRYGKQWVGCRGPIDSIEPPQPNPRKAAYHARMRGKWARAASFPYLPVPPDPPEPDGSPDLH